MRRKVKRMAKYNQRTRVFIHWLSQSPDGVVEAEVTGVTESQPARYDLQVIADEPEPLVLKGVDESALFATRETAALALQAILHKIFSPLLRP